jgi:hypothetical protein
MVTVNITTWWKELLPPRGQIQSHNSRHVCKFPGNASFLLPLSPQGYWKVVCSSLEIVDFKFQHGPCHPIGDVAH